MEKEESKLFSIDEVDPEKVYEKSMKAILNSPRSLEACRRLGINAEDLDPVTEDQVREKILQRERKKNVP